MISLMLTDLGLLCIVHFIGLQLFSLRFYSKVKRLLIFCFSFSFLCLINFSGVISNISTFVMTFVFFLYLCIQFISKLFYLILSALMILIIGYVSEFLAAFIMHIWSPALVSTHSYSIALLISLCINFSFTFLFIKVFQLIKESFLPKYSFGILILPIFTIIFICQIGNYYQLVNDHKNILFIIIGLFLSNILTLYFFYLSIQAMQLKTKLNEEKLKREKMNFKFNLLDQHYQLNFNFLHDLLHRGGKLYKNYIENNQEELGKEIEELNAIAFKEFNAIYSNNLALNTVINEKLNIIRRIQLEIRTEITSSLSFLSYDIQITFFTELLSIAIDIVQEQKIIPSFLFIRISSKGSSICIKTTISSFEEKKINISDLLKCFDKYNIIGDYKFNAMEHNIQILVAINL